MRRTRSGCCARAASGQVAAEPKTPLMKSRRLIVSPATKTEHRAAFKLFSRGLMLDMSGVHTYRLPNVAGLPPTPVFIGEGQPAPNVQWTFAATVLGPVKKTLILSAVTGEVERGGPWSSAAIIGKVLADASNRSIDTIAFDTNAGDAVRPPGLLHGVTPVAGAATGVDAVFEDRATLAGAIGDAGIRCDPAFRHPGRQQPDKIHVADRHHQHQGPG
jgi:hypothetical protein